MRTLLAAGLLGIAATSHATACETALPDHVRILDCRLAAAVADGAARSPILKDLLERVERTDGLVFVTQPPMVGPATRLLGGLSHNVSTAGRYRVLRIFFSARVDDHGVAVVGHELRHALELLELSTARSRAEVDELFDRLGWRSGTDVVETQAAVDAGYAIERELTAAKRR
ncbi:MAG TPA: hypothetical protein VGI12_11180 [Vicinamibacterales bacterium]|jgi:hypothetical protein